MLILRPEGRLFFANAQRVADQIQALVADHKPRVLALDMSRVFDIEYSALQMLMEAERRMTGQNVTYWMARAPIPKVLEYVRASGFADLLGSDRLFFNAQGAVRNYLANAESSGGGRSAPDPCSPARASGPSAANRPTTPP